MISEMRFTYVGTPDLARDDKKTSADAALYKAILYWHRAIRPAHFTSGANQRYHMRPRTRKYMIRKARYRGHQNALMWSGSMKRETEQRIRVNTAKYKKKTRVRGTMWARVMNFIGRRSSDFPDLAGELTFVTYDEQVLLLRIVRQQILSGYKQCRRRRVVVVK